MITVENLSYQVGGKEILKNISFSVEEGSMTCIVGPNGVGKTTLLRVMMEELSPSEGYLKIGHNVFRASIPFFIKEHRSNISRETPMPRKSPSWCSRDSAWSVN